MNLHQLQFSNPSELKEFCVGLLEKPKTHPWYRELSRADGRKALSVAGSLFLFRKALPAEWSEAEMCRKHRAAMIPACRGERPPLPDGYLQHVKKIVASQFTKGWDRSYVSHCWTTAPSVGACLEASRSQGGSRSLRMERDVFLRRVLGNEWFSIDPVVRYQVVPTGGKGRGVTIASADLNLLRPAHKTVYDHMSSLPWLLRGEAKSNSFKEFKRVDGEVFVSGDYESASDNLRVEVAEAIIDVLQSSSSRIPSSVWEAARGYLRCRIKYPDLKEPLQSEGQLMGNLLCFPLLCLQNYVAFRWTFDDKVPVKINGDDIVFRAPRSRFNSWADSVSSLGLVLSRGKTLVNDVYFSLNSSFFWSRRFKKPRPIPVTRVAAFTKQFEDWSSLPGSFRSFTRGFTGEARHLAEVTFLRHFRKHLRRSGRSVRRGIGIHCSIPALQESGLWRRECWYFDSVPAEFDQLPPSPSRNKWMSIPPGWKRVPASSVLLTGKVDFLREGELTCKNKPLTHDSVQKLFWSCVISRTWTESPTRGKLLEDYTLEVLGTGFESLFSRWKKRPRKAFLRAWQIPCKCRESCRHQGFRVDPRKAREWTPPPRQELFWAPEREVAETVKEWIGCSVSELVEYEPLRLSPPRGREEYYNGNLVEVDADYTRFDDWKY